jgi:hypothetical protein
MGAPKGATSAHDRTIPTPTGRRTVAKLTPAHDRTIPTPTGRRTVAKLTPAHDHSILTPAHDHSILTPAHDRSIAPARGRRCLRQAPYGRPEGRHVRSRPHDTHAHTIPTPAHDRSIAPASGRRCLRQAPYGRPEGRHARSEGFGKRSSPPGALWAPRPHDTNNYYNNNAWHETNDRTLAQYHDTAPPRVEEPGETCRRQAAEGSGCEASAWDPRLAARPLTTARYSRRSRPLDSACLWQALPSAGALWAPRRASRPW